jgi:hypothetical protein
MAARGDLSAVASLEKSVTHCKQVVGAGPLFILRCDRSPVMLNLVTSVCKANYNSAMANGKQGDHPLTDILAHKAGVRR